MAEFHPTPGAVTLVAIDIAKGYHDVLIEPPAPTRRRRFRMSDSAKTTNAWRIICVELTCPR
jgi:hypothetical protein